MHSESPQQLPPTGISDSLAQQLFTKIQELQDEIAALKISNQLLKKDVEQLKSDAKDGNNSANTCDDLDIIYSDKQSSSKQISNPQPFIIEKVERDLQDLSTGIEAKMSQFSTKLDKVTNDQSALKNEFSDQSSEKAKTIGQIQSDLSLVSHQVNTICAKGTQIYGPYCTKTHEWKTKGNGTGLKTIDTTQKCLLRLMKKSLVTLTANMHAHSTNGASILAFQINGNILLPPTGFQNWKYGAGFINDFWHHVGYTQEYILEAGDYEVSVGVDTQQNQSGTIQVNAFSFTSKVTEL